MSIALAERLREALKETMKAKDDALRLSTLRLINAAIKDQVIEMREDGQDQPLEESTIQAILAKMVKQRLDSIRSYEEAGRLELAEQERQEILVIEEFLPTKLSAQEVKAAINAAILETQAESIRDMAKVMGVLKAKYVGQIDFGAIGAEIKKELQN